MEYEEIKDILTEDGKVEKTDENKIDWKKMVIFSEILKSKFED